MGPTAGMVRGSMSDAGRASSEPFIGASGTALPGASPRPVRGVPRRRAGAPAASARAEQRASAPRAHRGSALTRIRRGDEGAPPGTLPRFERGGENGRAGGEGRESHRGLRLLEVGGGSRGAPRPRRSRRGSPSDPLVSGWKLDRSPAGKPVRSPGSASADPARRGANRRPFHVRTFLIARGHGGLRFSFGDNIAITADRCRLIHWNRRPVLGFKTVCLRRPPIQKRHLPFRWSFL